MASFSPLPTGSDALWLHSFGGLSANSLVHAEHCTCRCGASNNGLVSRSSMSSSASSSSVPFLSTSTLLSASTSTSSRRSSTLKRLFQTSLALLFVCSAFLIYLHSPPSSSAEELDAAAAAAAASSSGTKTQLFVSDGKRFIAASEDIVVNAAVNVAPERSRRMIRALRSSAQRADLETNEIQPQQPPQQQQQQHQQPKDISSSTSSEVIVDSPPSHFEESQSSQQQQQQQQQQQPSENTNDNTEQSYSSSPSSSSHSSSSSQISQTELKDILFTVKTTAKFHKTRLPILLDTWVSFVRDNTYFFTDADDAELSRRLPPNRLVNTNCSASHNRKALCCKMAAEFDAFLKDLKKRWFCHVDDDTYVNVPEMLHLLRTFDHREDWYLGKPSLRHPIEIIDRDHASHLSPAEIQMRQSSPGNNKDAASGSNRANFWFATGGAGFCISRGLASKMAPIAGEGRFKIVGDNIRMTDDITMGYIVEHVLKRKLTVVDRLHSHLESMRLIPPSQIESQVTLSYGSYGNEMNVLRLKGFPEIEDPSRLRSLHCRLFPGSSSVIGGSEEDAVSRMSSSGSSNPLICPDRTALLRR